MALKSISSTMLAALLSASGWAQVQPAEQPIQRALEGLRARPGLRVLMTGSQTMGNETRQFRTTLYWYEAVEGGRRVARCEALGVQDNQPVFRIVGDGTTLWTYDSRRNEYSAIRYGNYQGAQPANYTDALLSALSSVIQGRSALPARLLNQVYGGDRARYRTWMPGVAPLNSGETVLYQIGMPVRRRVEFFYTTVDPNVLLNYIEYEDRLLLGGAMREIAWRIDVLSLDSIPIEANFTFSPPASARAIAGVRPVTAG